VAQGPIPLTRSTAIRMRTPGGGFHGREAHIGTEVDARELLLEASSLAEGLAPFPPRPRRVTTSSPKDRSG
jgi:hypothetical protein